MTRNVFVCTVHIGSDTWWADAQTRFLRRHLPGATIVAAISDDMDPHPEFDHVEVMEGILKHKLDELARQVVGTLSTDDDDVLMFIDGDAFPIRDLWPFVEQSLADVPLAAVCREEANEDFPHPCFCVTTVGFWKRIGGTWEHSSRSPADPDEVNDEGAWLRDALEERGFEWRRLLRSNAFDLHPLLFGLYGGLIYHQGAGFRRPMTALDRRIWRASAPEGTWTSREKYEFFFDVVAGQHGTLADLMKRLITHVPDFHVILETVAE